MSVLTHGIYSFELLFHSTFVYNKGKRSKKWYPFCMLLLTYGVEFLQHIHHWLLCSFIYLVMSVLFYVTCAFLHIAYI